MAEHESLLDEAKREGIEIVRVAVIAKNQDQILLLERHQGLGGEYELPSSVVKEGEEISQCLSRALMMQAGLEVDAVERYLCPMDEGRERTLFFVASVKEPKSVELAQHIGYAWTTAPDAFAYPISENLRTVLSKLC